MELVSIQILSNTRTMERTRGKKCFFCLSKSWRASIRVTNEEELTRQNKRERLLGRTRENKGKGMSKGAKACHNMANLGPVKNSAWPKQTIRRGRLERTRKGQSSSHIVKSLPYL